MTTLPQTTSVRLPRPAGNGQLAVSSGGLPALPGGAAPAAGMTANDAWRVIRANAWLIILFLIVSGVAGYFINSYLAAHHPKFTATGYLEVQPLVNIDPTRGDLGTADVNVTALEQKTQVAALQSEGLLSQVLQNESSELRKTQWYTTYSRGGSDNSIVKEEFADAFRATAIPETRYVKVEFTGAVPKDCQTIVREICEQHITNEQQGVMEHGREQSVQLERLKAIYQSQETNFNANMDMLRNQIAGAGGEVGGRIGFREFELQRLSESLNKAENELQSATGQLTSIQESLKKGIDPLAVEQMIQNNQLLLATQGPGRADRAELRVVAGQARREQPEHHPGKEDAGSRAREDQRAWKWTPAPRRATATSRN